MITNLKKKMQNFVDSISPFKDKKRKSEVTASPNTNNENADPNLKNAKMIPDQQTEKTPTSNTNQKSQNLDLNQEIAFTPKGENQDFFQNYFQDNQKQLNDNNNNNNINNKNNQKLENSPKSDDKNGILKKNSKRIFQDQSNNSNLLSGVSSENFINQENKENNSQQINTQQNSQNTQNYEKQQSLLLEKQVSMKKLLNASQNNINKQQLQQQQEFNQKGVLTERLPLRHQNSFLSNCSNLLDDDDFDDNQSSISNRVCGQNSRDVSIDQKEINFEQIGEYKIVEVMPSIHEDKESPSKNFFKKPKDKMAEEKVENQEQKLSQQVNNKSAGKMDEEQVKNQIQNQKDKNQEQQQQLNQNGEIQKQEKDQYQTLTDSNRIIDIKSELGFSQSSQQGPATSLNNSCKFFQKNNLNNQNKISKVQELSNEKENSCELKQETEENQNIHNSDKNSRGKQDRKLKSILRKEGSLHIFTTKSPSKSGDEQEENSHKIIFGQTPQRNDIKPEQIQKIHQRVPTPFKSAKNLENKSQSLETSNSTNYSSSISQDAAFNFMNTSKSRVQNKDNKIVQIDSKCEKSQDQKIIQQVLSVQTSKNNIQYKNTSNTNNKENDKNIVKQNNIIAKNIAQAGKRERSASCENSITEKKNQTKSIPTNSIYSNNNKNKINNNINNIKSGARNFNLNQTKTQKKCVICDNPIFQGNQSKLLSCAHRMHLDCIPKTKQIRCPKCDSTKGFF
ncbi:hypothetical protein PPERSA_10277 [Pseudocohnilembus persalinus]|uniref:RING-type domain-containing protein n=1 Tax=Pseudocohnilembus persalinus TaxID=266149 RepID=A0A0V0R093_PSEPJ|nr:hypothetical protein PPERSA_10277 [Pseudocohnilembus persalinus]|eukprot:KRX07889.1 hypothetical protein PPERSA_10277 [Pseudocohnilembus persalinus]